MKPSYLCSNEECDNYVENKDTGLCASCSHSNRDTERKATKDASKKKTPIKKVADKRAGQLKEYAKLRKEYLALYPICEVDECNEKATEINHQRGREGERLLDTNFFFATCHAHHVHFTEHSKEAIEKGFSVKRNGI